MAAQNPFTVLLDSVKANLTSNLTITKPAYCPLECLDIRMSQDVIFLMVVLVLFFILFTWWFASLCHHPTVVQQHKYILMGLTRTPNAERNEELKRLCIIYDVEYTEVEDDGAGLGGYEEYRPNIWGGFGR
jgi:hypothetical protein